jgi:hypothetical protein
MRACGPASQAGLDVKHAIAGDELCAMSGTMAIRNDALPRLRESKPVGELAKNVSGLRPWRYIPVG